MLKAKKDKDFKSDFERLSQRIKNNSNIVLIDETYSHNQMQQLMTNCNAYISMHCAEGFGLNLAEAMLYKKPTIATAYSGNLDFMNVNNSFLIPYEIQQLTEDISVFKKGTTWAKPYESEASKIMRYVHENYANLDEVLLRAEKDIQQYNSLEYIGFLIANRLRIVHNESKYDSFLKANNLMLTNKIKKYENLFLVKIYLFVRNKILRKKSF